MLNFIDKNAPIWLSTSERQIQEPFDSILTVASYNIKFGMRVEEARSELSLYPFNSADIILLQEMDETGTVYLSEKLGYNYVYFPISTHPKHKKKFGNAILSKWSIDLPEKILLPHAQPINKLMRGATSAVIKYGDINIRTCSVHLETPVLSRTKRLQQLKHTLKNVQDGNYKDHIIVGGDFNSFFSKDVAHMVNLCNASNLQWNTGHIGYTLSRFNFVRPKLDHIFSKGFELIEAGKIANPKASDHSPIWVKLKIKKTII